MILYNPKGREDGANEYLLLEVNTAKSQYTDDNFNSIKVDSMINYAQQGKTESL
jgi:hypothetical protein